MAVASVLMALVDSGLVSVTGRGLAARYSPTSERDRERMLAGADHGFDIVQVAVASTHTCALRQDGSLSCWGGAGYGVVSGPNDDTARDFVSIDGSFEEDGNHICALRRDGTSAAGATVASVSSTSQAARPRSRPRPQGGPAAGLLRRPPLALTDVATPPSTGSRRPRWARLLPRPRTGARPQGATMPNAYISGTGFYVPPRIVKNDDLASIYGIETSDEWIRQRSGIEQRHFADEGSAPSDLAVPASEQAIANAGIDKSDVDMLIFATLSPDQFFPGSGVYLQQKLGLCDGDGASFVPCLDIRNQCSGFVYGLATAASMVRSGQHKNVLVVGSEVHSAALDLTTRGRTVASLFGDAAGAVVVSATEEDRGIRAWDLGADGRFADQLSLKVFDFTKRPYIQTDEEGRGVVPVEAMWPYMEGQVVFKNAIVRMVETLGKLCEKERTAVEDIDLFLCHQANLRINQMVQNKLGAPDAKFFNNIQKYGNTTAATLPILMHEARESGRLKDGMKVALVAFGAGFTWGSMIVDW